MTRVSHKGTRMSYETQPAQGTQRGLASPIFQTWIGSSATISTDASQQSMYALSDLIA